MSFWWAITSCRTTGIETSFTFATATVSCWLTFGLAVLNNQKLVSNNKELRTRSNKNLTEKILDEDGELGLDSVL